MGERGSGETATGGLAERAVGPDLVEHPLVVGRVDDDADVRMVLRCGAHHRRSTDVDQFDARIRRERVEVDDHEIDRLDAVMLHVGDVLGVGRVGEDPAVDLRMQGDHTMAENRGEPGQLRDVGDGDTGVADGSGGTAARHQVPPQLVQGSGELDDAGLVVDGEQRSGHVPTVANEHATLCMTLPRGIIEPAGPGQLRC